MVLYCRALKLDTGARGAVVPALEITLTNFAYSTTAWQSKTFTEPAVCLCACIFSHDQTYIFMNVDLQNEPMIFHFQPPSRSQFTPDASWRGSFRTISILYCGIDSTTSQLLYAGSQISVQVDLGRLVKNRNALTI